MKTRDDELTADRAAALHEAYELANYIKARISESAVPLTLAMSCLGIGVDLLRQCLDHKQAATVLHNISIDTLRTSERPSHTLQ